MIPHTGSLKLGLTVLALTLFALLISGVFAVFTAAGDASTLSAIENRGHQYKSANLDEPLGDVGARIGTALSQNSVSAGPRATYKEGGSSGQESGCVQKPAETSKTMRKFGRSGSTQASGKKALNAEETEETSAPQRSGEVSGPRLSILVIGDSLAVGVGMTLNSAFEGRGRVAVRAMGKRPLGWTLPRFIIGIMH